MNLPAEIIDLILNKLKFDEILSLRLVSQSWKNTVEGFCSRKRSLTLIAPGYTESGYNSQHAITNDRLFRAVTIERFLQIDPVVLDRNLTHFISRLFPNIQQLAFGATLNSSAATNFVFLLSHWKNISTLIFVATFGFNDQNQIPNIAAAINGLHKLIRFDLRFQFNISLLGPTLARINHLSLGFKLSFCDLLGVIHQIGPNCSRLWIKHESSPFKPITLRNVQSLMKANVGLFNRLTHFGCSSDIDDDAKEFIDSHFQSLHTLFIAGECQGTFAKMGHISRLNELRILRAYHFDPLISLESDTRQMKNVLTFELRSDFPFFLESKDENVKIFCSRLAWLLPNVKHLTLVFHSNLKGTVEIIKQNLFMFPNLCTCQVKLLSDVIR